LAKLAGEFEQEYGIHSQRLDFAEFLAEGIKEQRRFGGRDDLRWVAVESDRERNALMLPGIVNRLADHLPMPEMNAVEHPDRHADFAPPGLKIASVSDQLHVIPKRKASKTE
jgi:hypothetical protein